MPARRPLAWHRGEHGPFPDCEQCLELATTPLFTEAVYSVSIEHPGEPAELARRTIEHYHAEGHPAGWV